MWQKQAFLDSQIVLNRRVGGEQTQTTVDFEISISSVSMYFFMFWLEDRLWHFHHAPSEGMNAWAHMLIRVSSRCISKFLIGKFFPSVISSTWLWKTVATNQAQYQLGKNANREMSKWFFYLQGHCELCNVHWEFDLRWLLDNDLDKIRQFRQNCYHDYFVWMDG